MRPYTPKRAARNRKAAPFRRAMLDEVLLCEVCNRSTTTEVHEIARGNANRMKAQDKRYAILVVCWACHRNRLSSRAEWPEARQLAALRRSRPGDYDIRAFNTLVGCGSERVTEDDVDQWSGLWQGPLKPEE